MSNATHSLPTSSSSSTEPKKKFGTNLNKLTKPPPAANLTPSSASFQANSSRGAQLPSSSSRGGLLVLSTKRSSSSSSGLLGTAKISGGAAPKPVNTPSLRSEAVTSYDALQIGRGVDGDAGAGAAGTSSVTTQPTAWGVVDKVAATNNTTTIQSNTSSGTLPVLAPKGGVGYGERRRVSESISSLKRGTSTTKDVPSKLGSDIRPRIDSQIAHAVSNRSLALPASNKSELDDKNEVANKNATAQVAKCKNINERIDIKMAKETHHDEHMRKHVPRLPKERTENRRKEDMTVIPQDIIVPPTIKPRQATTSSKDAEVVLELLGPKHTNGAAKGPAATISEETVEKNKAKAMIKSAKTFSSLVGGTEQKPDPHTNQQSPSIDDVPPVPFIQLSSYDDRDRGERAGPRMLFDPKSGSMVAAPSDKRATSFVKESKPRKERPRTKSRAREKDTLNAQPLVVAKRLDHEHPLFRRNKKSNDDAAPLEDLGSRGRRSNSSRTQNNLITPSVEPTNVSNTLTIHKIKTPRTCGVLYKFDEHGNYISADGCDPDQGYGSHSIPGGRKRYPHAYAKYLEQQRILSKQHLAYNAATAKPAHNGLASNLSQPTSNDIHQHHHSTRKLGFYTYDHQVASNFYHNNESSSAKQQQSYNSSSFAMEHHVGYNYTLPPSSQARTKTESKNISILDPELSPELQATANPWAPNEAALAYSNQLASAAAATSGHPPETSRSPNPPSYELTPANALHATVDSPSNNTDNEECEASQSFEGLGFDPTENMDAVIMSPSVRSADDENMLDFQTLTLNSDSNVSSRSTNDLKPFALTSPSRLLDASTWSTAGVPLTRNPGRIGAAIGGGVPTSSALNWNLLGAESSSGETPPPHHLRSAQHTVGTSNSSHPNTRTNVPSAATFLSLSPMSSHHEGVVNWGTLGGLGGGIDIAGLSMRPTKSSKDTSE